MSVPPSKFQRRRPYPDKTPPLNHCVECETMLEVQPGDGLWKRLFCAACLARPVLIDKKLDKVPMKIPAVMSERMMLAERHVIRRQGGEELSAEEDSLANEYLARLAEVRGLYLERLAEIREAAAAVAAKRKSAGN